ncbi:MAG TPA: MFS transporter [Ramlibacter sp.]|jgi:Na+/melibiose symporter-like transporter|uniref:MFS transporter n=1 Tax=Ramlibacter sp. TaxID=1917967 RepID=UPI002D69B89B|nr:MFS transporter [Ramlibacter sp.]HZY17129.1 MFS transporter [Ramlibacter sp.]
MTAARAADARPARNPASGHPAALALTAGETLRYGLLGLPLAFVALPLYVLLPSHYAREFGAPLAALGAVLLAARALDALADPLIGRWVDRLHARSADAVLRFAALGALVLAGGFGLLFLPPVRGSGPLLAWGGTMLVVTSLGYSAASIAHQSWGAMLGGDDIQRSRVTGHREALALLGVLLAAVVPAVVGPAGAASLLVVLLAVACWTWWRSPRPAVQPAGHRPALVLPLREPAFRRLLLVFVVNGVASAIPASLVLFFVQDRLQAPRVLEPAFLGTYFLCAALSVPGWLALVRRIGLARTWLAGMGAAVVAFGFAIGLGPGDSIAFFAICAASGLALGTDLALPSAMLAGLIARAGHRGRLDGAYFGWWNLAAKASLALSAGLALPAVQLAGYTPGRRDDEALAALTLAYCLLPIALKLLAAGALYWNFIRSGGDA